MAHILLAEDDQSMCAFLGTALERAGHRVTACYDGLQALAILDGPEDFDLLLTDIVMPGLDGVELSQKAMLKRPNLKVMYITGFAAVAMGAGNPALKNTRILSKPFHLKDLVEQVDMILRAS